jgi:pimeloyl-ACP methyl ester carboxylesterase
VIPDLPGCGLSSPPAVAADLEFYLDFLREFSQRLGLERFVLLGSSLGCQIGAHYAQRQAEVEALVLCSPFGLSGQGRTGLARRELLLRLAAPWVSRARLARELEKAAAEDGLITPQIVDSYWSNLRTPAGRRVASQLLSRVASREPLESVLPLVAVPVLILLGENDPLSGRQYLARFQAAAPHGQVVVLPGLGHFLHLQAPQEVARQVEVFLRAAPDRLRKPCALTFPAGASMLRP